ncbi:uncharacterized protein LOC120354101 [Nilaparvata lugens]|uniref:uncharacterized protein LOC120354101 n=1 Tax=Nilaparvata lugens TaxID=108931 RepID=UPI00193D3318|nr:uncharacterized protein LOC120354101 [Nilaparvata lugens]
MNFKLYDRQLSHSVLCTPFKLCENCISQRLILEYFRNSFEVYSRFYQTFYITILFIFRANLSIEGLRKNRPSSCDISSGSSTDSVQQYGKYNVADRIQTLSPIPSSGSLTTIKYPAVTNPRSRRTSVTNSVSSHKSARLSQQDAQGYATLRFLHRGRRPLLNTTNQLTTSFNQLTTTFNQLTPLSPIEQLASADLRRQISPLVRPRNMVHQVEASEFEGGVGAEAVLCDVTAGKNVHNMMPYQSSRSCIARGSDASGAEESSWSGPTYLGICLPHNLCDLFPSDDLRHDKPKPYNRTDVDTNQDAGADNSSADSETDTGTDSGGGGGVALLAVTAANSNRQRRRHDRQNCLLCTSNRAANQRVSRLRKISSSSTHRTRTETESSYGAPNEGESPIMLPWQTRGGLEGVNSVDSSSSATSIVHRSPMDNMRSRSMVRRDILKMASQLANPVLYKTCKQALLQ